jgi:PKD repeat protein
VYQFLSGSATNGEYFLVENRQRNGYDGGLPGVGLLIYHVDAGLLDNTGECYPGGPSCFVRHYKVALAQADNRFDLERMFNEGDAGDPWPGLFGRTYFGPSSSPSSVQYNGQSSFAAVTNISGPGTVMTATLFLVAPVEAIFSGSPTSGVAPHNVNFTDSSIGPITNRQWNFGDGFILNTTSAAVSHNYSAPGIYSVTLTIQTPIGNAEVTRTNYIDVGEPPVPAVILTQPFSQNVSTGATVTLSASFIASNPRQLQWRFNGFPLRGATNASLTLPAMRLTNAGTYTLEIRNNFSFALSQPAILTVGTNRVAGWGAPTDGAATPPPGLNGVRSVAAGRFHSLALRENGTVLAWGANTNGQSTVPSGLSNVIAIAAGGEHSLALRSDGKIIAWGANNRGQTNLPVGLAGVVALAAGGSHSLALRGGGTVVGWGANDYGQANVPPSLTNVVAIGAGDAHSFALKNDGTVAVWGRNLNGQATPPPSLGRAVAAAGGTMHSAALRTNGTIASWGGNSFGQALDPVSVTTAIALAVGDAHNLVLLADRSVVGWGADTDGQATVPLGLGSVLALAAGGRHSLAIVAEGLPPDFVRWRSQPGNLFEFTLRGTVGQTYLIENTADFTNWSFVTTLSNATGTVTRQVPASGPGAFFRARVQ